MKQSVTRSAAASGTRHVRVLTARSMERERRSQMMADALKQEALERAKKVGISPELMEVALRQERKDRPYVVELENQVEGSFYRVTQEGPSKVLYLNIYHPFFSEVYMVPGSTERYRDSLEILLWTLGLAELEADEASKAMYVQERQVWSKRLSVAATKLAELMDNEGAREIEMLEAEQEDEDD